MSDLISQQEQELSSMLRFKDDRGQVAAMIGLLVTVFFDNQLTREVREAVADVAEDYIHRVREHLRWAVPLNAKREVSIDAPSVKFPKDWLPQHPDGKH